MQPYDKKNSPFTETDFFNLLRQKDERNYLIICFVFFAIGVALEVISTKAPFSTEVISYINPSGGVSSKELFVFPLRYNVIDILKTLFYTLAATIFVSVFIVKRLSKVQDLEKQKELEATRAAIKEDVFKAIFKRFMPDEIFHIIKAQIIEQKVIRKDALWMYDFIQEGNRMKLEQTFRYSIYNLSAEEIIEPVTSILQSTDDKAPYNVECVICNDGKEDIISYDCTDPSYSKNIELIPGKKGQESIKYTLSIPANGTVNMKLKVSRIYKNDIKDAYISLYPTINATLIVTYPEGYEFGIFPFFSNELKREDPSEKNKQIYKLSGGILPKQGFYFYLNEKDEDIGDSTELRETLTTAAHDFNNALSAIIGYTEMGIIDMADDNKVKEHLKKVYDSSQKAKGIVKKLIDAKHPGLSEFQPIHLIENLRETVEICEKKIHGSVCFIQNYDLQADLIRADPYDMRQCIENIILFLARSSGQAPCEITINAVERTISADEPAVEDTIAPGNYVELEIYDNSTQKKTIPAKHIFNPYLYTKELGVGAGYNLSFSKNVVSTIGGTIAAEQKDSAPIVFTLFLPLSIQDQGTEPIDYENLPRGTEIVLLVDEEDSIVEIGKSELERLGYHVFGYTDSLFALEAFRNNPNKFDLIITDMGMQSMDGIEFAKEAKTIRSDIKMIVCTGYSEKINAEKAAVYGFEALIMKPLNMQTLATMVRKTLDKKMSAVS